jgi:hypothetical protein
MLAFFLSTLLFFINPVTIHAHPGRTDSSGGHTCRTNCASWGLADGEYHDHGGGGSSGGSTGNTNPAPVIETEQAESNQKFMEYRNSVLTGSPTNIPTRIPIRMPTRIPTQTVTVTPLPTSSPSPIKIPKKNARPVRPNVQTPSQPGFFEWLMSLFRGR